MNGIPTVELGNTGLRVSKLGYGTVDLALRSWPVSPQQGGRILAEAYRLGINFWDTSDDYGSHPHIAAALKHVPRKGVVISTKTHVSRNVSLRENIQNSLGELGTDYIDIFLLHAVEKGQIEDLEQTLEELESLKARGIIKAAGLSTHSIAVVKKAAATKELEVILATCCKVEHNLIKKLQENIPLEDGTMEEMFQGLKLAHSKGKGVIAMKVLATGDPSVVDNYQSAIRAVSRLDFVDAIVIGMRNLEEVKKNIQALTSN